MPRRLLLQRWDDLPLDRITEMVARKTIAGRHSVLVQAYLKKGTLSPRHTHEAEQLIYVLQGALRAQVDGEDVTAREGEVIIVPRGSVHQAEALDDTFVITFTGGDAPRLDDK